MTRASVGFAVGVFVISLAPDCLPAGDWPSWRGPAGTGVASADANPPVHWDAEQGIGWKVELPGPGNSSPIVVGDKVFITQFAPESRDRLLLAYDLETGTELWRHAERVEKDEWTHPSNPLCNATPASDGKVVVAFLGQAGLVCCDLEGKLLWKRQWGSPEHLFGGGPSPVIVDDRCIVTFGPGRTQFYAALELATGEDIWRIDMPRIDAPNPLEGPNAPPLPKETDLKDPFGSWATPLLVATETGHELAIAMPGEVRGVDIATGKTLWSCDGPEAQVLCSPTFAAGHVIIQSGVSLAVQPGGEGDVSETGVQWRVENDPARIGSPLVVGNRLYGITMNGVVDCRRLDDGTEVWKERLREPGGRGGSWTSLVASGDRIYALTQSGTTFVFKAGDEFEQLATNTLGEATNATPAIAEGVMIIRTNGHLWCVRG